MAIDFKAHAGLLKAISNQWQRSILPSSLKFLRSRFFWISACCCCALILCLNTDLVFAQENRFSLFDGIQSTAELQSRDWLGSISRLANSTFRLLAVLEICWAAAIWAIEKDNLSSLAAEMIQKIMFIGFFYALLQYAPSWIPTIIDTFREVGQRTLASTREITPDSVMSRGLNLIDTMWAARPTGFIGVITHLGQYVVAAIVSIGILISSVVIALQLLALNIESYILLAAGAFLLALGSSRWTSEYVSKYLQYALGVGMRLLVLLLILGLTNNVLENLELEDFEFTPLLRLLAVVLMQAILALKAPEMGSALMSGGIGFSAGAMKSSVNSITSATSSAVGTAAGAAKGLANTGISGIQGVKNAVGLAKAGSELKNVAGAAAGGAAAVGAAASLAKGQSASNSSGGSTSNKGLSNVGASGVGASDGGAAAVRASSRGSSTGGSPRGASSNEETQGEKPSVVSAADATVDTGAPGIGPTVPEQDASSPSDTGAQSGATPKSAGRELLKEVGRSAINKIKGKNSSYGWNAPEGLSDSQRRKIPHNPGAINRAMLNVKASLPSNLNKGSKKDSK